MALVEIKLSPGDVAYATTEAVSRFNYNRAKGNDASRGAAPTWVEQVAREISGCLGEIAIARWQDKFPFTSRGAAPTWVEQVAREISGCLGEIAIARWQDKFPFTLFADRKSGDVGEFEVRTTAYQTGKLLIDPSDNPERKYLLVTLPSHYTANIIGWMYGWEAQDQKFFDPKMRFPCYAIQQEYLRDPRSLVSG